MQTYINNESLHIDMFPRTSVFLKTAKNPLTCSRKRKVQKISPRHQSERLVPCGVRGIDNKAVSLYLSGFPNLHQSCLLDLKVQNTYMETYRRGILG
jgi:hypothetical protein